jgi:hypothetical protein
MKKIPSAILYFSLATLLAGAGSAAAQSAPTGTAAEDCKEYGVDYRKNEELTQKEILERMDQALYKSLNKYDECLQQSNAAAAASGGGGGGASGGGDGSGSEGSGGSGGGSGSAASAAASGIAGTEKSESTSTNSASGGSGTSGQMAGDAAQGNQQGQQGDQSQGANSQGQSPVISGSGKTPEDIPPADNDTVLQQKVREAAMNEPDPEKRARLWNEYRKLKGMSQI